MGVTYLVKAHLANNKDDYEGNKDSVIRNLKINNKNLSTVIEKN